MQEGESPSPTLRVRGTACFAGLPPVWAGGRAQEEKGLSKGPGAAGRPRPGCGCGHPVLWPQPRPSQSPGCPLPRQAREGAVGTAARNTEGKGLMCAAGAVEHPALTSPEIAVRGQGEWALTPVDSRPRGTEDACTQPQGASLGARSSSRCPSLARASGGGPPSLHDETGSRRGQSAA